MSNTAEPAKSAERHAAIEDQQRGGKEIQPSSLTATTEEEAATNAVSQRVFQTSELLTNILVYLPAKNIFILKRVCRSFAAALDESPKIQEKLFLRQRIRSKEAPAKIVQYDVADLNPFFRSGKRAYPVPHAYGLSSADYVEMRGRPRLRLESSILDTHLFDVPCGRIILSLRVECVAGSYFAFTRTVYDQGETIRNLFEKALCQPGRIVWIRGHDREEVVLEDTSLCKICEEWDFLIDWRTAAHTRIWFRGLRIDRQY